MRADELAQCDERKSELEQRFPGWAVWFVPHAKGGVTWCARPQPLLNCDTPDGLAAAIRVAHSELAPETQALAPLRSYTARVRRLRERREAERDAWLQRRALPRRVARRRTAPAALESPDLPDVIA